MKYLSVRLFLTLECGGSRILKLWKSDLFRHYQAPEWMPHQCVQVCQTVTQLQSRKPSEWEQEQEPEQEQEQEQEQEYCLGEIVYKKLQQLVWFTVFD